MIAMEQPRYQDKTQGKKMRYLVSVEESIKDILITPLGSRVMRPEYGSRLFELIDKKVDDEFRAKLALYVAEAIHRWESRAWVERVRLISFKNNSFTIRLKLKGLEDMKLNLELNNA